MKRSNSFTKFTNNHPKFHVEDRFSRRDSFVNLLPKSLAEVYDYTTYTLEPHFLLPDIEPIFTEKSGYKTAGDFQLIAKNDRKSAGMKIFASILLNAWRRRRDEVRRLTDKVEYLKSASMKARSQIQYYNSLFRDEQRRNDELAFHLKRSVDSIGHAKSSCDALATSVVSLRADKALMEQELRLKYKDYNELHMIFAKNKSELYQSLVEQRVLESNLIKQRRKVKNLEEQKSKLINEICELRAENSQMEEKFREELERRDLDLCRANEKIKILHIGLDDLKEKALRVDQYCENDIRMHSEIELLQTQVAQLEDSIGRTLDCRMRALCYRLLAYHNRTCQLAHWFLYYLLPATPPPSEIALAPSRAIGYL